MELLVAFLKRLSKVLLPMFTTPISFSTKYPRIREWAYAGLVFDVIGAIYSQIGTGQSFMSLLFPLMDVLLLFGSYYLYHKRLTNLQYA